jgi:hypothetical protein
MICNLASDISTKSTVWTITDLRTGRWVECVPAHKIARVMRQLELERAA